MKKIIIIFITFLIFSKANAINKKKIINNLQNINNISFNFEQNINGNIENGSCIIQYPKKIFCKYKNKKNKILISNGNSIVIKDDSGSYYRYALIRTPLNLILDKKFIIKHIKTSNERIIEDKYINYVIVQDNNEINIFFNTNNFDLIGWQIVDIYENLNITFISSLVKNQIIDDKIFILPSPD